VITGYVVTVTDTTLTVYAKPEVKANVRKLLCCMPIYVFNTQAISFKINIDRVY